MITSIKYITYILVVLECLAVNGFACNTTYWITLNLLQEVVQQDEHFSGKSPTVKSFNFTTDLGRGESSTLARINLHLDVDGNNETWSYIAKSSLDAPFPFNISNSNGIFPKENEMLGTLIPEFEKLYKDAGVEISFGPKCYKIFSTSEYFGLILEDLRTPGFKNSKEELNLEHTLMTLKKMAQFHAASVVYEGKNGPYKDIFKLREVEFDYFDPFYHNQMISLMEEISTWPGYEREAEILETYRPVIHRIYQNWCNVSMDDFAVLCHADLHNGNTMFQYLAGSTSPVQVKFLDFQLSFWTSPVFDILFFISTSITDEIRKTQFDFIFYQYQLALEQSLKTLKYDGKIPKLKDIQIDLLRRGIMSLTMMIQTMFPSDIVRDEELIMLETKESKAYRKKIFSHPEFKEKVGRYLKFMVQRGIIDFNEKL